MANLLTEDKRKISKQIKSEILRNTGQQQLNEILDLVLSPKTSLDNSENLEWCRLLISGGRTFEEFAIEVRQYDNASTCGLVWTSNFVAYRCRTCGISPCMSICADCFHGGDHTDHDFNMFRSQAGGACDCGDPNVMRSAGFCSRHGPDKLRNVVVPVELLPVSEVVVPRIVFRFVLYLRDVFDKYSNTLATHVNLKEGEPLLGLLHELCNMGGAMRRIMTRSLTDQQLYKDFHDGSARCYGQFKAHISKSQDILFSAQNNLSVPECPKFLRGNPAVTYPLIPLNFVEELLFWAVIFEFPEKTVTLLLKLLPDDTYKDIFTRSFVKFYGRIAMSLATSDETDKLSSRVVHISVQLFSNEDLAIQMTDELQLIHILVVSLQCLLKRTLVDNCIKTKGDPGTRKAVEVVNCQDHVMKKHCYWPVISDLSNILSHRSVVNRFFSEPCLIKMWTDVLAMFMCMNLNEREMRNHVEFEPDSYSVAFSSEIEACAAPMWQLYMHCKDETTANYTQVLLQSCVETIEDWLKTANISGTTETLDPYQVSFHIPLLRYYALFLSQALTRQGLDVIPSQDFLKKVMHFPMQIQAVVGEICCGMWVRNGMQIKRQAFTYKQCHFCASLIDLDLFLLQVCATNLEADYFMDKVFSSFKVRETLTFNPSHNNSHCELDKESAMLESALTLLVTLLSTRTYLGAMDEELLRQEMVALLCMHDATHSWLTDQIPEKTGLFSPIESFEPILAEVADYHDPMLEDGSKGLQQGRYTPKPTIWEQEFDPVHVLLRVMFKKDFQSAMERYTSYMKQTGRHTGSSDLWPPFKPLKHLLPAFSKLLEILHCKTLHGAIFILLYKAVHSKSVISEPVLYLSIALLDMMLQCPANGISSKVATPDVLQDGDFKNMFPDNNILSNLCHRVTTVAVFENSFSSRQQSNSSEQFLHLINKGVNILDQLLMEVPTTFPSVEDPETMQQEEMYVAEELEMEEEEEEIKMWQGEELDVDASVDMQGAAGLSGASASVECSTFPFSTPDGPVKKLTNYSTYVGSPNKTLTIKETMLELLVKLHSKMTGKKGSYVPPSVRPVAEAGSKEVGGGAFYIQCLLDKICVLDLRIQKQLEELCRIKHQPKADQEETYAQNHAAERRKKAREAQKKLVAKFAADQMKFLEKSLETDEHLEECSNTGDEGATAAQKQTDDKELFECVICGQTVPPTVDQPIGMVALMQATGVLGHRYQTSEPQELPTSDDTNLSKAGQCKPVNQQRKRDLLDNFDKSSVRTSINVGWHGGVHIQSCRHYIHLSCHESYIKSLRDSHTPQLRVSEKGEYECPLCRQLANFVLPCLPPLPASDASPSQAGNSESDSHAQLTSQVMKRLAASRDVNSKSSKGMVWKVMQVFLQRLTKEIFISVDKITPLLLSTARVNLELDLVNQKNALSPTPTTQASSSIERTCLGTLLDALGLLIDDETVTMATRSWWELTEVIKDASPLVSSEKMEEVPILVKDPVAVLIHLVLSMPHPILKEHFSCIVKVLYTALYVQALSVISCRMSESERRAWTESGNACQDHSTQLQMQSLLSQVISQYSKSRLYEDSDMQETPAICQSVWTLQCVETTLQEYCLPFLRIAALMQHHLFREQLTSSQTPSLEFELLVNFLHLCTAPSVGAQQPDLYSTRCLHFTGEPSKFLTTWCSEFLAFVKKNQKTAKSLLLYNPIFYAPRLLQLPKNYDAVFQYYREKLCVRCKMVSNHPAVCLVCGALICLNTQGLSCSTSQSRFHSLGPEHSLSCGAGTTVYLDINSSATVIVRGERVCFWASVYLDRHGEEDRNLKRGKPLFLRPQRYKVLEDLWRNHSFNHCCKNWSWHRAPYFIVHYP